MQSDEESEYSYDLNVLSMLAGIKDVGYPSSVNSTPRHAPPPRPPPASLMIMEHQPRKSDMRVSRGSHRTLTSPSPTPNSSKATHRENELQNRVQHLERLLKEAQDKERVSARRAEGALNTAREVARQREAQLNDLDKTKATMSSIGVEKAGLISRINNLQTFLVAEKKARLQAESEAKDLQLQNTLLASQLEASQRGVEDLRTLLVEASEQNANKTESSAEIYEKCLRLQNRLAEVKADLKRALHELEASKIDSERLKSQVLGLQLIIEEMTSCKVMEAAEILRQEEEKEEAHAPPTRKGISSAPSIPICRMKAKTPKLEADEDDDINDLDDQMVEAQMRALSLQRTRRAPLRAAAKSRPGIKDEESKEEDDKQEEKEENTLPSQRSQAPRNPPIRFLPSCPSSLSPRKSPAKVTSRVAKKQSQIALSMPPIEVGPVEEERENFYFAVDGTEDQSELEIEAPGIIPSSSSRADALRLQLRRDLDSDDDEL
jgi:hypothetical protein